jgi:prevent-host-death family protein
MKTYTITESKAQLSALVERVLKTGEPVVIGRSGQPMVQLVPFRKAPGHNRLGAFAGRIQMSDDFDQWDEPEAKSLGLAD